MNVRIGPARGHQCARRVELGRRRHRSAELHNPPVFDANVDERAPSDVDRRPSANHQVHRQKESFRAQVFVGTRVFSAYVKRSMDGAAAAC